jgi:hypothetical protein
MGKETQRVNAERKRQRYSKEFKLAAVKLLQSGTKPGTLIAMELGIQRNLLYKWAETLKQHGGDTKTVFQNESMESMGSDWSYQGLVDRVVAFNPVVGGNCHVWKQGLEQDKASV